MACFLWVNKATLVAPDLEVVRFYCAVGSVLDLEVAQDILLGDALNVVVDGREDSFCAFCRVMYLIVHVVISEIEVIKRYITRSDLVGTPPQLRSEEASLVAFRSVRREVNGGVDDEDGLVRHFGIGFEDFGQFLRLCLSGRF